MKPDLSSTAEIRTYVQGRERDRCRCCRFRRGFSMHEVIPKSLGGKVSKTNSIWVCGDGVLGCHGRLQRHEIEVAPADLQRMAEAALGFEPQTDEAAGWMQIEPGTVLLSEPMREYEA